MAVPLPNVSLKASAESQSKQELDFSGASYAGSGAGGWNIDFGTANSPTMSPGNVAGIPLLWIVLGLGAAWLIFKK